MRKCDQCDAQFETFQAKANHVRWKHKESAYTPAGLEKIKASARALANSVYGEKIESKELRLCECGNTFEVNVIKNRKTYTRKTCSPECAHRRKQSVETNNKRSLAVKHAFTLNPELFRRGQLASNRFSSKAERALATVLQEKGFKRHKHVTTDELTFDVDIVSLDDKVWIESDGEWHFRKIHDGHNFEATKFRDELEEREAIKRCVLLIRVNNQTMTIEEQVTFIEKVILEWDKTTGKVVKSWDSHKDTDVVR